MGPVHRRLALRRAGARRGRDRLAGRQGPRGHDPGLRYVPTTTPGPVGSGHPLGALWDDGADPVAGAAARDGGAADRLGQFGPRSLPAGAPRRDLRRQIVPIYLFHRYQVEAAAKLVGGVDFGYAEERRRP